MKKFVFIIFCSLLGTMATKAQVTSVKNADDALKAADFLLSKPINVLEDYRDDARAYLFKWMDNTSEYIFSVDHTMTILDSDAKLMGIYFAAMVKYQIEHKIKDPDDDTKTEIWKVIAEYIKNKDNNVKIRGSLKKLLAAYDKGKIKQFLNDYDYKE
ncbi:hypothetical protein [Flavobacterium rhizosphaerae]|uniref:Uncharacterized protein n=1 Tax=Flavobacterium rhizosphaerae TaxID=3163298 RepID=A0ABW8YUP0_9FLAO